jgi:transposase
MQLVTYDEQEEQETEEEWRPISEAAKHFRVSRAKLSRWVNRGRISSRKNPRDERETLVSMRQLRQIFGKD